MFDFNIGRLTSELKRDEGVRSTPYRDSRGNWTIGVGHLITDGKNLPKFWGPDEIDKNLRNDIQAAYDSIKSLPWYVTLDTDTRRRALVNMSFNLGIKLLDFHTFLEYLGEKKFSLAALDLTGTAWHQELPERSGRIISMIRNG